MTLYYRKDMKAQSLPLFSRQSKSISNTKSKARSLSLKSAPAKYREFAYDKIYPHSIFQKYKIWTKIFRDIYSISYKNSSTKKRAKQAA